MSANPLVAQAQDSTTWYTGLGLVEDAYQISSGIQGHSWVDGTLGAVGGGLDTLSLVVDPLGSLVSWGVSWLMEHVKPLKEALDWLAGNADEVAAHAATWKNVAQYTSAAHNAYQGRVNSDVAGWTGSSGDAYRAHAATQLKVMEGISVAAGGISYAVEGAGVLVGMVRGIVRDLIAQFVATLAVRLPEWLAEEGVTLGLATPVVVGQVVTLVAKWVDRIQGFVRGLINSLRRLKPMLAKLGDIFTELSDLLKKLTKGKGEAADVAEDLTGGGATPQPHPTPVVNADNFPPDLDGDPGPDLTLSDTDSGFDLTLNDADKAAVGNYSTTGSGPVNNYLRNPEGYSPAEVAAHQADADNVSRALSKLPDAPGTTYRGVNFTDDILDKYVPGETLTEHGFTSTSRRTDIAMESFEGNTYMVVTGRSGKDIEGLSEHPYEAETLYNQGTQFQVISKNWEPSINKWVITMQEAP